MAKTRNEWYIIVNPHAGSGKTMSEWVPAENILKELGVPFYTVYTTHKHHAAELAAMAARTGYRKILAVGGDGSIHEVFEGVLSWCEVSKVPYEDFYLAVVPIGSGNDWIKSYGLPRDSQKVVEILAKGNFVKQDIVKVTLAGGKVSYMTNIGGVGFDSHVCDKVNKSKERGMRSSRIYLNALLFNLFHIAPVDIDFYCDDELVYSGKVLDIAFGNGSYCGGGMQQCSLANPGDGILDAMIVPKIPINQLLKELPRIYTKSVHESKKILYCRGSRFRVIPHNAESADIVELDGEIVGNLPVEVELLSGQVNVLFNKDK
ncbi:MAG: diacylglycerol/lipid kinase family protein [Candidatus Cryptobacteroides sp.]